MLRPMLAQPAAEPFSREGWGFELKYDGIRALVSVRNGVVKVVGRGGHDETLRYPEAQAFTDVAGDHDLVVDAEIIALDDLGRPSFQRLQPRIGAQRDRDIERLRATTPVSFAVFDLLEDGEDVTALPLRQRKQRLHELLSGAPDHIAYVDHVETDGLAFFDALRQRGLEGMIGKRLDAPYQPGTRSPDWVKVKAWHSQTCAIAGYTRGTGSRAALGALVLAVRDASAWHYAGNVGSGFTDATVSDLRQRLAALVRDTPALVDAPRDPGITWTRLELYCEVRHAGFSDNRRLRHPVFLGLRSDVSTEDCRRVEAPRGVQPRRDITHVAQAEAAAAIEQHTGSTATMDVDGLPVHLTNLNKMMWPGIPKRRLIAHYVAMAPLLLPHLADRGVTAQVFPDGIDGKSFWRKQVPDHAPDWLTRWTYTGERRAVGYAVADSAAALAWLANSGAIDLHPWHSRTDAPDQPDWAVFDLDPSDGASFDDVVVIAKLIKVALDHLELRGYLKTTGQTGLQIYVPIHRGPGFPEVLGWVEGVARAIGKVVPDKVTWEWTVSKRDAKVRIDYTQNVRNKTLAAPYSLRPTPGAPVSTPLYWDELDDLTLRSDRWTIDSIAARVAQTGDLFAPVLLNDQDLPRGSTVTVDHA